MDVDRPPELPDPGGSPIMSDPSPSDSRKRPNESAMIDSAAKKIIVHPSTVTPSIQLMYVHPSFSEGPKKYSGDDKGSFIVHVSREVADSSAGTTVRVITFGQFLHEHKISSIINDGVKNIGRNKISVEFSSGQAANEFLNNPILGLCKYKSIIPTYNVTRMGLVKGVPVEWSMEEFVDSLEIPSGCGDVMKARRLNRKVSNEGVVTWVPTQSIVITFRGQILPPKVYSYHTSLPVEMESCDVVKDNATCLYCSGKHFASDNECPEYSGQ